jgi:hypothetical protein
MVVLVVSCAGASEERKNDAAGAGGSVVSGTGGRGGSGGGRAGRGSGGSQGGKAGAPNGGAGTKATGGRAGTSAQGGESTGGTAGDAGGGVIGGEGGEAGGGDSPPPLGECRSPSAYSPGLELCEGGFVHRPAAVSCSLPPRDPDIGVPGTPVKETRGDGVITNCIWDADCGDGRYCVTVGAQAAPPDDGCVDIVRYCVDPCEVAADCPTGNICVCDREVRAATQEVIPLGRCVPASCAADGDCAGGALCVAPYQSTLPRKMAESDHVGSFRCQTAADECWGPTTCPDRPSVPDNTYCEVATCDIEGGVAVCNLTRTCDDTPCGR